MPSTKKPSSFRSFAGHLSCVVKVWTTPRSCPTAAWARSSAPGVSFPSRKRLSWAAAPGAVVRARDVASTTARALRSAGRGTIPGPSQEQTRGVYSGRNPRRNSPLDVHEGAVVVLAHEQDHETDVLELEALADRDLEGLLLPVGNGLGSLYRPLDLVAVTRVKDVEAGRREVEPGVVLDLERPALPPELEDRY